MSSPILNPAIIALFLTFFGLKVTVVYAAFTFIFAVVIGILLDKLGMEREVKRVTIKGEMQEEITYDKLQGSFFEKNKIVIKSALVDAVGLFRQVFPYLLIGAAIGAFIYGFVPENLIIKLAGKSNFYSVPVAAIIGIPMYIRTVTMIPIAQVLVSKGMSHGTVMALIIGGAGASIPELLLLNSIFKEKMMVAFVVSIFAVAVITGCVFNMVM